MRNVNFKAFIIDSAAIQSAMIILTESSDYGTFPDNNTTLHFVKSQPVFDPALTFQVVTGNFDKNGSRDLSEVCIGYVGNKALCNKQGKIYLRSDIGEN